MARASQQSFQKRDKEKQRQQRQREKMARRLAAKDRPAGDASREGQEDPDLAGIRPGPQPLPEEWNYVGERDRRPTDPTETP